MDLNKYLSIKLWLCDMLGNRSPLNDYGKAFVAYLCWNIWKHRCRVLFKGETPDPRKLIIVANVRHFEFWKTKGLLAENSYLNRSEEIRCWTKPPQGSIKLNFDGAFNLIDRRAGIGIIARDCNGSILAGWFENVNSSSRFLAEILAVSKVIDLSLLFPINHVWVEMDCANLYKLCSGRNIL